MKIEEYISKQARASEGTSSLCPLSCWASWLFCSLKIECRSLLAFSRDIFFSFIPPQSIYPLKIHCIIKLTLKYLLCVKHLVIVVVLISGFPKL